MWVVYLDKYLRNLTHINCIYQIDIDIIECKVYLNTIVITYKNCEG